jgi:tetratricopeptide (TPR) repeat protein
MTGSVWRVLPVVLGLIGCESKYGNLSPVIDDFKRQLAAQPCDGEMAVKLADAYSRANDAQAALQVFRDRGSSCPAHEQALQKQIELEARVGDKNRALALASKLHELTPNDDEHFFQLLDLMGAAGKSDELLGLLLKAVALDPRKEAFVERLAKAYDARGDACRALVWWSTLSLYSRTLRGRADTEMVRLGAKPDCFGYIPKQSTKIKHTLSRQQLYVFPGQIAGKPVSVGLDNATAFSYLTKEAFDRIPNTKPLGQHLTMATAYGQLEGDLFSVSGITLGDMVIGPFDVVVVPRLEDQMDGLLGMTVQSRMRMTKLESPDATWEFNPP